MKKLLFLLSIMIYFITLSFSASGFIVSCGGYWNYSNNVDLCNTITGTNVGATSVDLFPTYNSSGDSSPNSYFFDGTNDYFDTTLTNMSTEMGFSWWYNGTETEALKAFFGSFGSSSDIMQILGNFAVGDDKIYVVFDGGPQLIFTSDPVNFNDGEWHHLYVGADLTNNLGDIWFDGVNQTVTVNGAGTPGPFILTNPVRVGSRTGNLFMDGNFDDIQIYHEMLNETEIINIFNYGIPDYVPTPPSEPPTLSNANYTNANIVAGENRSIWSDNRNSSINITSDAFSMTWDIDTGAECYAIPDFDGNVTEAKANNSDSLLPASDAITSINYSITVGNHLLCISCNNTDGNVEEASGVCSAKYNFTRLAAPVIVSARISPTTPISSDDLLGYCNASEEDGDNIYYEYKWYKDGVLNITGNTSFVSSGVETNVNNLSSSLTAVAEEWVLGCKAADLLLNSSELNSSLVTILPITVNQLNISLNGLNQTRKYELETTATVAVQFNSSVVNITVCLSSSDSNFGSEFECINSTSPATFSYSQNNLSIANFSSQLTSEGLQLSSSMNDYFAVEINESKIYQTVQQTYTLSTVDTNLPSDISIDWFNNGTVGAIFPGLMNNSFVQVTNFSNGNSKENLSFNSAGSVTRFMNISTHAPYIINDYNFSLVLSGFTVDTEEVNFEEQFVNDTYIFSNNGSAPSFIYDDFSDGNFDDRWDGDFTIFSNSYIQGSTSSGSGGGTCTSWETTAVSNTFQSTDVDLKSYRKVLVSYVLSTSASCADPDCINPVIGQGFASWGIIDSDLVKQSMKSVSSFEGCNAGGSDNDGSTATYSVEFRDDGNVYLNGVQKFAYSDTKEYYLYGTTSTSVKGNAFASGITRFQNITLSGFTSTYDKNLSFNTGFPYVLVSETINTTTNISRAKLTTYKTNPDNGVETLAISNDNGTTWTPAISGSLIPFLSEGNNLKVNISLNITNNQSPLIIRKYSLEVIAGTIENFSVDVGSDGNKEYEKSGVINESNSPINVSFGSGSFTDYMITSCTTDLTCFVPITFFSESAGVIEVSSLLYKQNLSEVQVPTTQLNSFVESNCSGVCNITSKVTSSSTGNLSVSNLVFSFVGDGLRTLTATLYSFAKEAVSGDSSVTRDVEFRYSIFDLEFPVNVEYYDVFPSSYNSKNVEPYGQTISKPILNFTNRAKIDPIKILACLNSTLDPCLKVTWSENYNQSDGHDIANTYNCTSFINVSNALAIDASVNIYNFWNLTNCSTDAFRFLDYDILYSSWCQDCVEVN